MAETTAPECPNGHGPMVLRPLARQTAEQKWAGTWYDCAPAPLGATCMSTVLISSPAAAALHARGA
jgi:hypothetical protein